MIAKIVWMIGITSGFYFGCFKGNSNAEIVLLSYTWATILLSVLLLTDAGKEQSEVTKYREFWSFIRVVFVLCFVYFEHYITASAYFTSICIIESAIISKEDKGI